MQFSVFRQFLSLKHVNFPKLFLLAPFGRSLVSQVVLRWDCGQNHRRLRMSHIYETTKNNFSRVRSAGTRVTRLVCCRLSKTEGKVDFLAPENPHPKTRLLSFRPVANTAGCYVRMAPERQGRTRGIFAHGTLQNTPFSRAHTSKKVTFPLLSRLAWTLALKCWL